MAAARLAISQLITRIRLAGRGPASSRIALATLKYLLYLGTCREHCFERWCDGHGPTMTCCSDAIATLKAAIDRGGGRGCRVARAPGHHNHRTITSRHGAPSATIANNLFRPHCGLSQAPSPLSGWFSPPDAVLVEGVGPQQPRKCVRLIFTILFMPWKCAETHKT